MNLPFGQLISLVFTENTRRGAGAIRQTEPLPDASSYKIDSSGFSDASKNARICLIP